MSLQDLCIKNIAASIQDCPPLIQELIIGKSTDVIKQDIKKELKIELTAQIRKNETNKIIDDITSKIKYMVPNIVSDIIASEQQGRPRTNFRARFWEEDIDIVKSAISIAEELVDENVVRYTTPHRLSYNIEMDSDSDSDSGSDWY